MLQDGNSISFDVTSAIEFVYINLQYALKIYIIFLKTRFLKHVINKRIHDLFYLIYLSL